MDIDRLTEELEILRNENQTLKEEIDDLRILNQNISEHNTFIEGELQDKLILIEKVNRDITDSVQYASKIQTAILPEIDEIQTRLPQSFVFYHCKDVVSGDFYWYFHKGEETIIAAVDCTGHGVPGAFMSFVGFMLLNEIIIQNNISKPSEILKQLDINLIETLKQRDSKKTYDGMDIAICNLNLKSNTMQFAAAYRPLLLYRNGELTEYKADRFPIGGHPVYKNKEFTNNVIELRKNDTFYIFSDGIIDQFSPFGKKYTSRKMKEFLKEIQEFDIPVQKEKLVKEYNLWKSTEPQIDDVLMIGIRI
jgi:serine phosphatase RsbU (regulator of sigma subunit)